MDAKVVYSFNHDITASFTLTSDPEFPKSDLYKEALICPQASLKGAKTLYIYPI
jgi:hypothetical protein